MSAGTRFQLKQPTGWFADTFVHRNVSSFPVVLHYVQYQALYAVHIEDTLCSCPGRCLGNAGTGSR
jgi:hypothetical protein